MELGISFSDCDAAAVLPQLKNFSRIEISGDMVDEAGFENILLSSGEIGIQVRELLSRKMLADLPEMPFKVCRDFLNMLKKRCTKMADAGIGAATLTPDIARAVSDKNYAEKLNELMLCIQGIAHYSKVDLSVELRLPESFDSALAMTRDFLNSSTFYKRLLIDFHIHEPRSFEFLPEVNSMFPFKSDAWRLSFELANGNYLNAEAVKRVAAFARDAGCFRKYLIFAPGSGIDAGNYCQLDQLAGECFHE